MIEDCFEGISPEAASLRRKERAGKARFKVREGSRLFILSVGVGDDSWTMDDGAKHQMNRDTSQVSIARWDRWRHCDLPGGRCLSWVKF